MALAKADLAIRCGEYNLSKIDYHVGLDNCWGETGKVQLSTGGILKLTVNSTHKKIEMPPNYSTIEDNVLG